MCKTLLHQQQSILRHWHVAYSRAATHHLQRRAPNYPSRRPAPDAGAATAGASGSQRGLEGQWGRRQPTMDCEYGGHDVGIQTADTRRREW